MMPDMMYCFLKNEDQVGGAGVYGEMRDIKYPYGSVYFVDYSDEIKSICCSNRIETIIGT
jgi:hypothetical protein